MSTREGGTETQGARQRTRRNEASRKAKMGDASRQALAEGSRHPKASVSDQKAITQSEEAPVTARQNGTSSKSQPVQSGGKEGSRKGPPSVSATQQLRRKRSVTMPGSLFPRSASLEPEPTPAAQKTHDRQVHFTPHGAEGPTNLPPPPLLNPIAEVSQASDDQNEDNPFISQRKTPTQVDRITSNTRDAKRFLEDFNLSPRSSPTPVSPTVSRTVPPRRLLLASPSDGHPSPPAMSAKAKGKQRAVEPEDEFETGDTSQVLRVNGKVQELRQAREERWQKEVERGEDPETSIILEERERDKERISQLEAEVIALKKQVCSFRCRYIRIY